MAVLLIEPVNVSTLGGYKAQITGIEPEDTDCFCGTIDLPDQGNVRARWNKNGICRDKNSEANLNPNDQEILDIIQTIRAITNL